MYVCIDRERVYIYVYIKASTCPCMHACMHTYLLTEQRAKGLKEVSMYTYTGVCVYTYV